MCSQGLTGTSTTTTLTSTPTSQVRPILTWNQMGRHSTLPVGPWSVQPESALVDRNHVDFVAGSEPGRDLCHTDIGQSRSRACAKPL